MEEERAQCSDGDEEEDVWIDIGKGLQAHLRCHSNAENEDEERACLEGALETSYTFVERGQNGEQTDAQNEDTLGRDKQCQLQRQ